MSQFRLLQAADEPSIPHMPYTNHDIDLHDLENRSILIIDDNHSIHRDYRAVLCPEQDHQADEALDELESMLFGEEADSTAKETKKRRVRNFQIQSAFQGEEAYEIVKKHMAKGIRYPLAFVDMRMPPGWDGLETIERIREVDPDMHFTIVTAYSDHTYEMIVDRLGPGAAVRILYKPFDPSEIYALSYKTLAKWNKTHS